MIKFPLLPYFSVMFSSSEPFQFIYIYIYIFLNTLESALRSESTYSTTNSYRPCPYKIYFWDINQVLTAVYTRNWVVKKTVKRTAHNRWLEVFRGILSSASVWYIPYFWKYLVFLNFRVYVYCIDIDYTLSQHLFCL